MKRRRRHLNLRAELTIWAVVKAITLTLALTVISVATITHYIERESRDDVAILANDAAQAFDHQMSLYFRMSGMAAGLDFLRLNHISPGAKRALLGNLQTVTPNCLWIGIAGTDGIVQVSGDGRREGSSVKQEPWFIEGLRQPMITPLREPSDSGLALMPQGEDQRVIDIARPLRDPTGNLIGVIDMTVSWKWALEFRDLLLRNRNNTLGIDLIITDHDGQVLIGPDSLDGRSIVFAANKEKLPTGEASPLVTAVYHNQLVNRRAALIGALDLNVAAWPDGGDYISAVGTGTGYQDFPGLHWNIVVRQPRTIAYGPAAIIRDRLIIAGFLFAVLFTGIGWIIADRATHSIRRLTRHARRLANGERGLTFSNDRGSREVMVLGETLDHLVENLLQREQQLLDLNVSLEGRIAERTAMLAASNRSLEDEMAQRQAVEAERETLIRQLRDQAEHDSLTGALNRRAFLVMAERDRRRQRREKGRLAVVMFDIDHFKRVNDSYGHATGDEVIRQVAAVTTQIVRQGDLFCRYGGEEFALLIADPGADRASLVAERLRRQVASLNFTAPGKNESFQVTISLGVTLEAAEALPEDGVTLLLERADQAMYAAKRGGRNRTVIDHQSEGQFAAASAILAGESKPNGAIDKDGAPKSPSTSAINHHDRPPHAANDG